MGHNKWNKILALLLLSLAISMFLPMSQAAAQPPAQSQLKGDCDGDGRITEVDALCALEMSTQARPADLIVDMDNSGDVTSRDAVIILQLAIGKTVALPPTPTGSPRLSTSVPTAPPPPLTSVPTAPPPPLTSVPTTTPRPTTFTPAPPAGEVEFFKVWSTGVANNGATKPTTFSINESWLVTYILNYHWNNAKGATPGTIGLRASNGTTYGPWQVTGQPGQGGVPNAAWVVRPNIVIPPDTYTVLDSDPSTWAQNNETGGAGMSRGSGIRQGKP